MPDWDKDERRKLPSSCQETILNRVSSIETKLEVMIEMNKVSAETTKNMHEDNKAILRKISHAIWGTEGIPGIMVRLDRQEQRNLISGIFITAIMVALVGLVTSRMWTIFFR